MTAAVILAAGEAKRAGGPKVIWPVEGVPSVRRVSEAALGASVITETVVVTGAWESEVREALTGLDLRIVRNPDFSLGQSGSLRIGLRAVSPLAESAIFLLGDQPFITSQIINDLVKFHKECQGTISAPVFKGRRRNPTIFDLDFWRDHLLAVSGDMGGRNIIANHPGDLNLWNADHLSANVFADFDTINDYENLTGQS